jgi:hypothetical protein
MRALTHSSDVGERLSAYDRAILEMERPANPVVLALALFLSMKADAAALAATLAERVAAAPKLRQRLVLDPTPAWRLDRQFDPHRHVRIADGRDLAGQIAAAMATPLPSDRPAWEIVVCDGQPESTQLLVRIHHLYGDGPAIEELLLPLADAAADRAPASSVRVGIAEPPRGGRRWAVMTRQILGILSRRADQATALHRAPSGVKRVAWTAPLDVGPLKRRACGLGCSLTSLALSGYARALRDWLALRESLGVDDRLRVSVPCSVRRPGETGMRGNRFGLLGLDLPVGLADARARLDDIGRQLERKKAEFEGLASFRLAEGLGRLPPRLRRRLLDHALSRYSVNFTHFGGPPRAIEICGRRVEQMTLFAPAIGSSGVCLSAFSYAGRFSLSATVDVAVIDSPQAILDSVAREFAELAGAAAPRAAKKLALGA